MNRYGTDGNLAALEEYLCAADEYNPDHAETCDVCGQNDHQGQFIGGHYLCPECYEIYTKEWEDYSEH